MASDDKQPGTNLASNSVILAAFVAAGTSYFINHNAPLQGSRPAMVEPQIHEMAPTQDIDARLWQDPFAAVAKSLDKFSDSEAKQTGRPPLQVAVDRRGRKNASDRRWSVRCTLPGE
jgi:hypothetical protein